ncbi:GAP family protein [Gryllotalpicola reticulitermitis]|uniref:GAP family protein n=1 Tax=Gryllotalpicola reticulitermitis TaxID=1184153 RepID=A0ABV8QAU8_9MICO
MGGDLARLLSAFVSLVLLGLTFGFSPPLYGVTVHLLVRGGSPRRSIISLTLGMGLGATLLLLIFRGFDPTTLVDVLRLGVERLLVQTVVDLVAGLLLVIAGLVMLNVVRRRPRRRRRPARETARNEHPRSMITVGFLNTAIGFVPPVTMYVTGRVIAGSTPYIELQLVGYAVFLAAVAGPYLAAGYVWRRLPRFGARMNRAYARLLRRDLRPFVAWALVAGGAVFLILGVVTGFLHR